MENKDSTYPAKAKCLNCKYEKTIQVPYGVSLQSYEPSVACDVCGIKVILKPVQEY